MLKGNIKSINDINKVERPEWFESSDTVTSAIDRPALTLCLSGSPQWREKHTHTHRVLGLARAAQCSVVKRGLNKSCCSSSVTCALAQRPQSNAPVKRVPGPLQPPVTVGRSQYNTTGPCATVRVEFYTTQPGLGVVVRVDFLATHPGPHFSVSLDLLCVRPSPVS